MDDEQDSEWHVPVGVWLSAGLGLLCWLVAALLVWKALGR